MCWAAPPAVLSPLMGVLVAQGGVACGSCAEVAAKAEAHLKATGIADTAYFAPEAEFYIFDRVSYGTSANKSYYEIQSVESAWSSDDDITDNPFTAAETADAQIVAKRAGAAIMLARGGYRPEALFDARYQVRLVTGTWLPVIFLLLTTIFALKVSVSFSRVGTLTFFALGFSAAKTISGTIVVRAQYEILLR